MDDGFYFRRRINGGDRDLEIFYFGGGGDAERENHFFSWTNNSMAVDLWIKDSSSQFVNGTRAAKSINSPNGLQ